MRMKKENMDHIRERFENETGVTFPERESFEMPAWTGRIIAAAAGLICLVGLGFVWHKVSVDKQQAAEMMLADGEENYEATPEDTEEAPETETEEGDPEITEDDEVTSDNDEPIIEDPAEDEYSIDPYGEEVTVYTDNDYAIAFFSRDEAEALVDTDIFGSDASWTWPVPGSARDVLLPQDVAYTIQPNYSSPYLSIPGEVGEEVVAMHACTVKQTGFDTEKGNFIITEVNGNYIIYSHLDTICVSEGDSLSAGDKIGTLGNTGASTGPHLGIEATTADGTILNLIIPPANDESFYNEELIED